MIIKVEYTIIINSNTFKQIKHYSKKVMGMKALNITLKDFEVSIKTKRFQIIIALFALLSLGMVYYSKRLGVSQELYKTPFQMLFLSSFSNSFNYIITLLAIILGSTLINSEIEKGTLRVLASKPLYRDQIIFGKFLGGAMILTVALTLFYLLTLASSLLLGIPITAEDLEKLAITFPFSLFYGLVFLNLGLLISTFIKKPKNALILGVFLFMFFSFILPIIAGIIGFAVAGLPPISDIPENTTNLTEEQLQEFFIKDPAYQEWLTKLTQTSEKVLMISPNYHYQEILRILFGAKPQINEIVSAFVYNQNVVEDRPLKESLSLIWQNITTLIVMFLLSFILTYTKFMKMSLR